MSPPAWVGLIAAGAVGAPVRYLVESFFRDRTGGGFPWGTFVVNATGSLLLGLLTGLALYHAFPESPRLVLGTGFLGAYTTFSTFTFETVRLLEEGTLNEAFRYAFATLVVCAGAAGAGLALAGL